MEPRLSAEFREGVFVPVFVPEAGRPLPREGERVELVVLERAAAQRAALLRELAELLRDNPFLTAPAPPPRLRW